MDVLYPCCAGIDVPKQAVSVCVLTPGPDANSNREVRQFGPTTTELRQLRDWLLSQHVSHAAMESTGVYWKPAFNNLDEARGWAERVGEYGDGHRVELIFGH